MRRSSLKNPTRRCHPDAAHSVNFPTASILSRAFLRYSNLDGSHLWHCSAESNSASQVAVATVAMHLLQIEFVVPSGLDRRTKSGCPFWLDYAAKLDWDPCTEIRGYHDLDRLGFFQDEWLRGGPVRRWEIGRA